MSATVDTVYAYVTSCVECADGAGPFDFEDNALEWAVNHDAENHETDTSDDDAYEAFKEARHDD